MIAPSPYQRRPRPIPPSVKLIAGAAAAGAAAEALLIGVAMATEWEWLRELVMVFHRPTLVAASLMNLGDLAAQCFVLGVGALQFSAVFLGVAKVWTQIAPARPPG